MRILIAEDDRALAVHLARAIEQAGHVVAVAHDLVTALARLSTCDVIVADQRLGRDDGIALVRAAIRLPGVEVIADVMRVDDHPLHWEVRGRCGFASDFDYVADANTRA